MLPARFTAVLKTHDDKLLEYGEGVLFPQEQHLEFVSDFVPLLKLGASAKIVRTQKDVETRSFQGQVYLSSGNLLRLVDVQEEILSELELTTPVDIDMEGSFTPMSNNLSRLLRKGDFTAKVHAVSINTIKFLSSKTFETTQQFQLSTTGALELKDLMVEIIQVLEFGEDCSSYRCLITSMPQSTRETLWAFMEEKERIFPKVL